jgi:hypothetical protein
MSAFGYRSVVAFRYRVAVNTIRSSVAVILARNGRGLDLAALSKLPMSRLLKAQFAWGDTNTCVAATIEHECSTDELAKELRPWADEKGWVVTVASLNKPR